MSLVLGIANVHAFFLAVDRLHAKATLHCSTAQDALLRSWERVSERFELAVDAAR
jgi:hypothetical protein